MRKMNIDLNPMIGKKLLCAVSGGADSMCLLHYLWSHGTEVIAAHYEHGIRAEESLRDAEFVESFCREHGIPFVLGRGDVPAYAKEKGMGIEEAAREKRYQFLEEQRQKLGCDYIVTAHNADDNAETVLMNLIRGSGAKGLSGIPCRRDNILRPLLGSSRADIEQYLAHSGVPHVEDSTNQSDDYTRNLIRHQLMPLIKQINPSFNDSIIRTTSLMRRDEYCLEQLSIKLLDDNKGWDGVIDCKALTEAYEAVSSRVIRALIPDLSFEHVDAVLDFCKGEGYGELDLPGRRILRDAGRLYISPPEALSIETQAINPGEKLTLPECGLELRCEICDYMGEVNDLFKTSYLKYEIIESGICVGPRKDGDRMRPLGRGCTKRLKDLFMEAKYPRHKRDACPVIRDGKGPLWVHGLALDERAAAKPGEKALKITFRKINSVTGE